jgi:hypothetical protein
MEKIKAYIRKEIITPLVVLFFLTIYVVSALKLSPPVVGGLLQESFFPLLIFVIAAPVALMLLFEAVKKIRSETSQSAKAKINIKPLLIAGITALFILGFEPLGFVITAPVYVFLFMLIYDDKPQGIVKKIIFALLISAFVYLLYAFVFGIRFPQIWS